MTRDEFVSKFKVGDEVQRAGSKYCAPVFITAIGEDFFLGREGTLIEDIWVMEDDWIKVEEPKKPSEEIREIAAKHGTNGIALWYVIDWLDENWPKVQLKENK